jgi:hypothetical protein
VGDGSPVHPVKLTNDGTAPLNISNVNRTGANADDFDIIVDTCTGVSLTADNGCELGISFAPKTTGNHTAALAIADNTAASPQTIPLSGTGITPDVHVNPSSLTFDQQMVNSDSSVQIVILTNRGSALLTIDRVGLTGSNPDHFGLATDCPNSLAPGQNCTIDVRFRPAVVGNHSATLTISSDAAGSPQSVLLNGIGTAPEILLNPGSLTFGGQQVGTRGEGQFISLTNVGLAQLIIERLSLMGDNRDDFIITTHNCPIPLVPGDNCAIEIGFAPTSLGNRSARLRIDSNAINNPGRVLLNGTGTGQPVGRLVPGELDFGLIEVGTVSQEQFVTLTNVGTENLVVGQITLTGADPLSFRIVSDDCPTSLLPGNSCAVSIIFAPTNIGNRGANLNIASNATGSPPPVSLNGTGVGGEPDLVVRVLEVTGPAIVNQRDGSVEVPVLVVVKNQGGGAADVFKVSTEYSGGVISPRTTFVVAFTVKSTADVDGSNRFYPLTRRLLPAGREVTFVGTVNFSAEERGATVSLTATADSCSGDELMPEYCRVAESNERNNESRLISMTLPPFIVE